MRRFIVIAVSTLSTLVLTDRVEGQDSVPQLIYYQGKLTNAASAPLPDGQYWIGVRVWDVPSGGTNPLWARKYQVPVSGGVFSLMLGGAGTPWETPLPLTTSLNLAVSSGSRFLEITVMSDADGDEKAEGEWQTLLPRQSLASVPTAMNGVPPGTVVPFAGTVIPDGWELCDGSIRDGRDPLYAQLRAAIQTTYGAGIDLEFRLPDLRGRTPIGAGQGNTNEPGQSPTLWTLGQKTGTETHKLTLSQIPVHNHNVRDTGHSHSTAMRYGGWGSTDGFRGWQGTYGGQVGTTTSSAAIVQDNRGGDQPHPNMQPSLVLNYIIKL